MTSRGGSIPAARRGRLSLGKKLTFSLATLVVVFGLAEALLALTGVRPGTADEDPFVGYSGAMPQFVEEIRPDGTTWRRAAHNKLLYFNPQQFPADKADGTYRIFCLGGSTTYGRPYADPTSFAGWLRELLPVADPSRKWEVINVGGISYASYRVAALMKELADYEPDLFVVYTGHNEFLEERTYGHLRRLPAPVRAVSGLLARTRCWTALSNLYRGSRGSGGAPRDGRELLPEEVQAVLDNSAGPEIYQRDDERADGIHRHFAFSLERIVRQAREVGARVVLVDPASNLSGCSPFKSEFAAGLSEAQRVELESLFDSAGRLLDEGAFDQARERLEQLLGTDPRHADAHYLLGRALVGLGRPDEAEAAFIRARDEDICPLRAPTRFQQGVGEVAAAQRTLHVDYDGLLRKVALERDGLAAPGASLFLDHVHPTIEAHRLLAVELIESLIEAGLVKRSAGWGPAAVAEVAARVESSITPEMHSRALSNLSLVLDWAGKKDESRRIVERAYEAGARDDNTLMMMARHAAQAGRSGEALKLFRQAEQVNPANPVLHSQFGFQLAGERQYEAAAAHFFLAALLSGGDQGHVKQLEFVLAARGRSAKGKPVPGTHVTRHPSGYPKVIAETRPGPDGTPVIDGVWTEWNDGGGLKAFADYRLGRPDGVRIVWDAAGGEVLRETVAGR